MKKKLRFVNGLIKEFCISFVGIFIDYMIKNKGKRLTGDEIADKIGLTSVTVRRYLNFLMESGRVAGEMNYETGGRPCMRYEIIKEIR